MWSRRTFLRVSASAGTLAASPYGLEAVVRASQAVARRSPEAAARDESYWREIRRTFTLDRALINLNNANSSSSPRVVHDAFKRHLDATNLLPVHHRSLIEQGFERVRSRVAAAAGCDVDELALTRNATEALHIAQCGVDLRPGDEVVTTDQDYPRMLWAWDQRARREGIVIRRIQFPVPTSGDELLARFERAITPRTRVLHFCHVTNVTGQLFPVQEICRVARERGIVTIVDGAQAFGHFPFALRDLGCDFYGTSLHKWLMAPHGTGFLYVRRDRIPDCWPLMPALDSLRANIRKFEDVGTHPAAARAAIADALDFHEALGAERKAARLRHLTLRWVNALEDRPRVRILSNTEAGQTWGLAALAIEGVDVNRLARFLLERHHVVVAALVSQGRPGPVLDFQALRVTPNVYTTPAEMDAFVAAVDDALKNGVAV